MPAHNPKEILNKNNISHIYKNFNGKKFLLFLENDRTIQPMGASYVQSIASSTYVMSKPGFVLFEKIAESLKKQNAGAFRIYHTSNSDNKILMDYKISISVEGLEIYKWKDKNYEFTLGKSIIKYRLQSEKINKTLSCVIKSKISSGDIFESLADEFTTEVYSRVIDL